MNVQTLCLGILSREDASGYEIKQCFEGPMSTFQQVSFGSIYPALAKMEEQGWVTYRVESQEKRPDKKVYSMTESGREALIEQLVATKPHEQFRSDFVALLSMSHMLSTDEVERFVREHIDNIKQEQDMLAEILQSHKDCLTAAERFSIHYGLSSKQARHDFLTDHLQQLLNDHQKEQLS